MFFSSKVKKGKLSLHHANWKVIISNEKTFSQQQQPKRYQVWTHSSGIPGSSHSHNQGICNFRKEGNRKFGDFWLSRINQLEWDENWINQSVEQSAPTHFSSASWVEKHARVRARARINGRMLTKPERSKYISRPLAHVSSCKNFFSRQLHARARDSYWGKWDRISKETGISPIIIIGVKDYYQN